MKKNNFLRNLSITTLAMCGLSMAAGATGSASLPEAGDPSSQQQNQQTRTAVMELNDIPPHVSGQNNVQTARSTLNFILNNDGENTVTIIGGSVNETGILYIPQTIGDYAATAMASNACFGDNLRRMIVPRRIYVGISAITSRFQEFFNNNQGLLGNHVYLYD